MASSLYVCTFPQEYNDSRSYRGERRRTTGKLLQLPCTVFGSAWSFSKSCSRFLSQYARTRRRHRQHLIEKQGGRTGWSQNTSLEPVQDYELESVKGLRVEMPNGGFASLDLTSTSGIEDCGTCAAYMEMCSLEKALCVDGIVATIAKHLHYRDIDCLGRTSKSTRKVLYMHRGMAKTTATTTSTAKSISEHHVVVTQVRSQLPHDNRLALLHMATCDNGNKDRCWSCDNQICKSCRFWNRYLKTRTLHHINDCVPYCSKCYFSKICRGKGSVFRPKACVCQWGTLQHEYRTVCDACNNKTAAQAHEQREKREIKEVAHLAGQAAYCASCESSLSTSGTRWWICNHCSAECTNTCHPSRRIVAS